MLRKFSLHAVLLVAANLLIKPIYLFGVDRVVQNQLGAETYGLYFAVFNFSFLLHVFLDMGLNSYQTVKVARNELSAAAGFNRLFGLKWLFSAVYFGFTLVLALLWGFTSTALQLLAILLVNQVMHSFILFNRAGLVAAGKQSQNTFLSISDRLLTILFCLLLFSGAFGLSLTLKHFVLAHTLALGISVMLSFVWVNVQDLRPAQPKFIGLKHLLSELWPFALLVLLMSLYTRIDAVMLERLASSSEAGIYAAAFRLPDAFQTIPFLLSTLLMPAMARKLKASKTIANYISGGWVYLVLPGIWVALGSVLFAQDVMQWLYPVARQSSSYANVFSLLALTFPLACTMYLLGSLFNAALQPRKVLGVAALGLLTNVGLNLWLIPQQGAQGAALATLLTQGLVAIGYVWMARGLGTPLLPGKGAVVVLLGWGLMAYLGYQTHKEVRLLLVALALLWPFLNGVWRLPKLQEWLKSLQADDE